MTQKFNISVILTLLIVLATWHVHRQTEENKFLHNIQHIIDNDVKELDLARLWPADWEIVCTSHGYDGAKYIKKYNKTYQPIGEAQDGAWGLIFISQDGSFKSVSGSERSGYDFQFGCLKRDESKLVKRNDPDIVWVSKELSGS